MSRPSKKIYFEYYRAVELILKIVCKFQDIDYHISSSQHEIDERLEILEDTNLCEKISMKVCGEVENKITPIEAKRFKEKGNVPTKTVAQYPKAIYEFGRKIRYDDKDKIYLQPRFFKSFKAYIGEPNFSPHAAPKTDETSELSKVSSVIESINSLNDDRERQNRYNLLIQGLYSFKEKMRDHQKYYEFAYVPIVGIKQMMKFSKEQEEKLSKFDKIIDFFVQDEEAFKNISPKDLKKFLKMVKQFEDSIGQDIMSNEDGYLNEDEE